jgi:hypothetical protein
MPATMHGGAARGVRKAPSLAITPSLPDAYLGSIVTAEVTNALRVLGVDETAMNVRALELAAVAHFRAESKEHPVTRNDVYRHVLAEIMAKTLAPTAARLDMVREAATAGAKAGKDAATLLGLAEDLCREPAQRTRIAPTGAVRGSSFEQIINPDFVASSAALLPQPDLNGRLGKVISVHQYAQEAASAGMAQTQSRRLQGQHITVQVARQFLLDAEKRMTCVVNGALQPANADTIIAALHGQFGPDWVLPLTSSMCQSVMPYVLAMDFHAFGIAMGDGGSTLCEAQRLSDDSALVRVTTRHTFPMITRLDADGQPQTPVTLSDPVTGLYSLEFRIERGMGQMSIRLASTDVVYNS